LGHQERLFHQLRKRNVRSPAYRAAVTEFVGKDPTSSRFQRVNLAGSRFRLAQLGGVEFRGCEFSDTRFRIVEMYGVKMRGVELQDVEISGDIGNLKVNGVEVEPLVEAELDRRYPERARAEGAAPPVPRGVGTSALRRAGPRRPGSAPFVAVHAVARRIVDQCRRASHSR
jgi:hypothetical protein